MSINHFPPELLTIILSNEKITLKQRIALRAVSSHWREVMEEHVLKKKTTELVLCKHSSNGTESNRLPYKDELVPLFIRLFPKLTNLSVYSNFEILYKALPGLLTALSTTLTTLKLKLYWIYDHCEHHDQQWFIDLTTAINSLSSLTSLHLNSVHDATDIFPQLVPTLTRLQRFYFCCYLTDVPSDFWQTITANTSLPNLTTLKIVYFTPDSTTAVADLVATFPSLQVLKLDLHFIEWNTLLDVILRHLASLEHLIELKLVVDLYFDVNDPLPLPLPTDQRLTQVKKLTWKYSSYLEDATSILVAWFPSLEVLQLCLTWGTEISSGRCLDGTTLSNLARLEQLIELDLSDSDYKCVLNDAHLAPPLPTERPIIILKRLHLLLGQYYPIDEPICTSALVAWFPSLQYLKLEEPFDEYRDNLTTAMLRDIGQLENLVELELPVMRYKKKHLEPPLPSDRPLACLKELTLEIVYTSKAFDASYFCSTVIAWFPALEVLNIIFDRYEDEEVYDKYKTTTSEVIRKRFDSLVKLNIN